MNDPTIDSYLMLEEMKHEPPTTRDDMNDLVEELLNYRETLRHIASGDGLGSVPVAEVVPMWQGWARASLAAWDEAWETNPAPMLYPCPACGTKHRVDEPHPGAPKSEQM